MNREEYIINSLLVEDSRGHLKCRERNDLEYKETFGLGSWASYAKTMAAFANNLAEYKADVVACKISQFIDQ